MMKRIGLIAYWLLTALTFAGALWLVFAWAPEERTMGLIQKIFYFHLPVAINTFLACTVVFIGGIGYLATRRPWWDDLSHAGAKVAVVLCSIVLLTGMLWAKGAWGVWWTWTSPRLTFSLMLWLLFVVYLIVRSSIEGRQRRAVASAVYGLIAYLDIPLVYLSARLIPDEQHPGNIVLAEPAMQWTLAACFVPITLLAAGLIVLQFRVHRLRRAQEDTSRAQEDTRSHAERHGPKTAGGAQ
jgi:heme exporter protein C